MQRWFRRHYEANHSYYVAKRRLREARRRQAVPRWADKKAIEAIYLRARALSVSTGVRMSVDHEYPLYGCDERGRHVSCGLHCEANLQIIPLVDNKRKGCRNP